MRPLRLVAFVVVRVLQFVFDALHVMSRFMAASVVLGLVLPGRDCRRE